MTKHMTGAPTLQKSPSEIAKSKIVDRSTLQAELVALLISAPGKIPISLRVNGVDAKLTVAPS
jgi:hypothetical protein